MTRERRERRSPVDDGVGYDALAKADPDAEARGRAAPARPTGPRTRLCASVGHVERDFWARDARSTERVEPLGLLHGARSQDLFLPSTGSRFLRSASIRRCSGTGSSPACSTCETLRHRRERGLDALRRAGAVPRGDSALSEGRELLARGSRSAPAAPRARKNASGARGGSGSGRELRGVGAFFFFCLRRSRMKLLAHLRDEKRGAGFVPDPGLDGRSFSLTSSLTWPCSR